MTSLELTSFQTPIMSTVDPPPPSGMPGILTTIGAAIGSIGGILNRGSGAPVTPTIGTTAPRTTAAVSNNNLLVVLLLGLLAILFFSQQKKAA